MARMTVEEIYSGDKYDIFWKVGKEYSLHGRPITCDESMWLILLTIKHILATRIMVAVMDGLETIEEA